MEPTYSDTSSIGVGCTTATCTGTGGGPERTCAGACEEQPPERSAATTAPVEYIASRQVAPATHTRSLIHTAELGGIYLLYPAAPVGRRPPLNVASCKTQHFYFRPTSSLHPPPVGCRPPPVGCRPPLNV